LDAIRAALDPSYVPKLKPVAAPTPEALVDAITAPLAARPPLAAAAQASAGMAMSRVSPAALPAVDPLSVPASPVAPGLERPRAPSHIPVSSLPNVNVTIAAPRRIPSPRASGGSLKYFLIGAAGTLVLAALIVPRMLRNTADRSSSPSPATSTRPASVPPA